MFSSLLSEPFLFLRLQPGSPGLVALGHSCEFTVSQSGPSPSCLSWCSCRGKFHSLIAEAPHSSRRVLQDQGEVAAEAGCAPSISAS